MKINLRHLPLCLLVLTSTKVLWAETSVTMDEEGFEVSSPDSSGSTEGAASGSTDYSSYEGIKSGAMTLQLGNGFTGAGVGVGSGLSFQPKTWADRMAERGGLLGGNGLKLKLSQKTIDYMMQHGFSVCDPSFYFPPQEWQSNLEKFSQQKCFENRRVTPYIPSDEQTLVHADVERCKCVKEHPANHQAWEELKQKNPDKSEVLLADTELNIKQKYEEINGNFSGLMLQANAIGSHDLGTQYTQTIPPADLANGAKKALKQNLKGKLKEFGATVPESKLDTIVGHMEPPQTVDKAVEAMEKAGSGCLTMQIYLKNKAIPLDDSLVQDISKMGGEFNESDWDYEQVKEQYNTATKVSQQKDEENVPWEEGEDRYGRELELESRISFLLANPLIKTFMSAKIDGMSKQLVTEEKLKKRKAELFKIIESHFNYQKLWKLSAEQKEAERQKYETALSKFFSNNDVRYITRMQAQADLVKEYSDPKHLEDLLRPKIKENSYTSLQQNFKDRYGMSTLDCHGKHIDDMVSCVQAFVYYCPMVEEAAKSLEKGQESVADAFERKQKANLSLDPEKNLEFKNMRKSWCEQKRKSTDGKKVATYPQFKKSQCSKLSEESCFARFAKNFPLPEVSDLNSIDAFYSEGIVAAAKETAKNKITAKEAKGMQAMAEEAKNSYTMPPDKYSQKVKGQKALETLAQESKVAPPETPVTAAAEKKKAPVASEETAKPVTPAAPALVPTQLPSTQAQAQDKKPPIMEPKKRAAIESEIKEKKERLVAEPDMNDDAKDALLERINSLEKLLAQQDKRLEEYKALLASDASKKDPSVPEIPPQGAPKSGAASSKDAKYASAATTGGKGGDEEALAHRGPASTSVPDQAPATPGGAGAAAGSVSKVSKGNAATSGRKWNEALLAKYGVTAPENAKGKIVVAEVKDDTELPLLTGVKDAPVVPLTVSPKEFEKFKNNDLKTLQKIYEKELQEHTGSVVKLSVSTKGEEGVLEFYAIREGGRVLFQPVRRHERKILLDAFKTT